MKKAILFIFLLWTTICLFAQQPRPGYGFPIRGREMTPPDTGMVLITKRLKGNQPAAFYEYPSLIPWLLTPSRLADSTAAVRADFPVGGSETVFFNTVSEIAGASLSIGDIAISKGFNSAGDGGGVLFIYSLTVYKITPPTILFLFQLHQVLQYCNLKRTAIIISNQWVYFPITQTKAKD